MNLTYPFVVGVVGLLAYVFAGNAKAARAGEIAYFVGLFWLVYLLAGSRVHL